MAEELSELPAPFKPSGGVKPLCGAARIVFPGAYFRCTIPEGHFGAHVAHGEDGNLLAFWQPDGLVTYIEQTQEVPK